MFDFAWSHFALLFIIVVVLLGPKELPTVLRFVGRWVGKVRQHKSEFQEYFDAITAETQEKKDPVSADIPVESEKESQIKKVG